MILKRYCIDCGKIEPPEGAKCCPDSRVFWVEKEAAERINATNHASLKTFEGVVAECHQLKARLAEFWDGHLEWMKRIQRERQEERERIVALMISEEFPYALCLPTSEDGDWEPVMEPQIRAALDPDIQTIIVSLD